MNVPPADATRPAVTRIALAVFVLVIVVLAPFVLFEGAMNRAAAAAFSSPGSRTFIAGAVFALLAADIILPVPSSLVSLAAGAFLGFVTGFAVIWTGMMAGCLIGYLLGRYAAPFVAKRLLRPGDLSFARHEFAKAAGWLVVITRPVPVLAEVVTLSAGVLGIRPITFFYPAALGNLFVAATYSAAGAAAMKAESLPLLLAAAVVIPLLARAAYSRIAARRPSAPEQA